MNVACAECEATVFLSEDDVPADGSHSLCSRCATPISFIHVPAAEGEEYFGPAPVALDTSTPFFDHFRTKRYMLRTRPLKIFGGGAHIYDTSGALCGYVHQKAFKLKEDVVLFPDEEGRRELLRIGARTYQDISGVYDVTDPASGERVGSLRRSGVKSLLRDSWTILDANGAEAGTIRESSGALAGARRFVPLAHLIPQTFAGTLEGRPVFEFKQEFNPFVSYMQLDFYPDTRDLLDRRLGIAAGLLMALVEGRQNS